MAGKADHARAPVFRRSQGRESSAAIANDGRDGGKCLYIIDQRRRLPGSHNGGKRRLHTWYPALAFNGIQQRGFLATLVGAGARVSVHVEIEPSALNVLAQISARIRFRDGAIHGFDQVSIFTANINVALMRIDGASRD